MSDGYVKKVKIVTEGNYTKVVKNSSAASSKKIKAVVDNSHSEVIKLSETGYSEVANVISSDVISDRIIETGAFRIIHTGAKRLISAD